MSRRALQRFALIAGVALARAASATEPPLCSAAWNRAIAAKVMTGDAAGHGPDIGSDEWKSVVEFRLGLRGKPGVPNRDSEAWCRYVDERVDTRAAEDTGGSRSASDGPSFDCRKVAPGSIEALVCSDSQLSALDRTLSEVYASASNKAHNEHPPMLKAEQRGWIKGRDDCWKSDDKKACVGDEYRHRIAQLQARYRLVSSRGPFRWACDGNPANEVVVTFFATDPPTLVAEHGDSTSLMFVAPSGSGSKYQGRNETYWEHQGEAIVTWGYGAPEMHCRRQPADGPAR